MQYLVVVATRAQDGDVLRLPTYEALVAALAAATDVDAVPEGWYTPRQLGAEWSKHADTAKRTAEMLVAKGLWEAKEFRILCGRKAYSVKHYRPKA